MQLRMSPGGSMRFLAAQTAELPPSSVTVTIAVKSRNGPLARRRLIRPAHHVFLQARVQKERKAPCRHPSRQRASRATDWFLFLDCFFTSGSTVRTTPAVLARSFTCGVRFIMAGLPTKDQGNSHIPETCLYYRMSQGDQDYPAVTIFFRIQQIP